MEAQERTGLTHLKARQSILFLALLVMPHCALQTPTLRPSDATHEAAFATAQNAGIHVAVASHYWNGAPADADSFVTSLAVDISNHSDRHVRISLRDLAIVDDGHMVHRGMYVRPRSGVIGMDWLSQYPRRGKGRMQIPEWQRDTVERLLGLIDGDVPSSVLRPDRLRSGAGGVTGLPWRLMILYELPDRTLAPGERTHGFVFFRRAVDESSTATVHWRIHEAGTDEPVAYLTLPFVVSDKEARNAALR